MSQLYFEKVVDSAVRDVAASIKGGRNENLNKAAFSIGRHAHLHSDGIDGAILQLHSAAKQIGLNDIEIKATIGSGFKRGGENPKQLENTDIQPYIPSELDSLIARLARQDLILQDEETRQQKIERAQKTWERSVPITRDNLDNVRPALLYLRSRALKASTVVGVARYNPNFHEGPAIIFPAFTPDGDVEGIQGVLLTQDGKKREHNGIVKYSRGVIAGNVMQINEMQPDRPIIITEGPEDALSVRQACGDEATVICTFGKAGMATYVPPRASDVTICADPDLDVEKCADVLSGDGSTAVYVVRFNALDIEGVSDANDYLRALGKDKLREALATAKPYKVEVQEQKELERQWPTEFEFVDPASIPPRRWIYGRHYIRGYVSVLASMGGVGKTSMQNVESVAICTGKPLLEEAVHESVNVWVINGEDPLEEMQRRYAAIFIKYNIKPEDIRGKLFLDAGRELGIQFAISTRDGILTDEDMLQYMVEKIKRHNIGMVFIDPWVGFNDINENDNVQMNKAVAAARWVADQTGAAIVLTHHVRKTNGDEVTVDSVRGAGSLIGAARAARVINKVTSEQVKKIGISEEDARGLFRVDDGKANLAPPADKALYRRMEGVELPNGEWVGVCVPFKMPDLFDGVSVRHAMDMQRMVAARAERDEPFLWSAQASAANWAGAAVASILDLDLEKPHEKAKAKSILETWIKTDVLRKEDWHDKRQGKERPAVYVGEWIRASEVGQ